MKVLKVASNNDVVSPFIIDQAEALKKCNIDIDYFLIRGAGIKGYIKNYSKLINKIKEFKPDVIHAHYGFSGLLSCFQRKVPVITTFHGSDINIEKNRFFSKLAYKLSKKSIFVSKDLANLLKVKNPIVIPCGVDFHIFKPFDKKEERKFFNLDVDKKYVLFSSSFQNKVKNYPLAKEAIDSLDRVELLELKGYSREEVARLMSAVDAVIMTSFTEGSPQFIKEALSCNCSVVSVNVGDVEELFKNKDGVFLAKRDSTDIAEKLSKAIVYGKTSNRDKMREFDNSLIAKKITELYQKISSK